MALDTWLIIVSALLGWLAAIVTLHDSALSEPLWGLFLKAYNIHHDHLRGPLWFHRFVNRLFIKTRFLRLGYPEGSIRARSPGALNRRHNLALVLATFALLLAVISTSI